MVLSLRTTWSGVGEEIGYPIWAMMAIAAAANNSTRMTSPMIIAIPVGGNRLLVRGSESDKPEV